MLRNQFNKSFRTVLNNWTTRQQLNWPKVNYHFGDRSVFGYQKETRNFDSNLSSVDTVNEKQLIDEFRSVGHFLANINPLDSKQPLNDQLQKWSDQTCLLRTYLGKYSNEPNFNELIDRLTKIYCSDIGIEFMHITNVYEREWIANHWENLSDQFNVDDKLKRRIAEIMIKCETFDEFLAIKFPSLKRYGAEGAESLLVFFDELFRQAAYTNPSTRNYSSSKPSIVNKDNLDLEKQITDIVIGMPHRGRLNFLTILNQYPEVKLFSKLKGRPEFDMTKIDGLTGDVASHLFNSINLQYNEQGEIINDQTNLKANSLSKYDVLENKNIKSFGDVHISLLANPSHLEAICPAVSGKVRAKLLNKKLPPYYESKEQTNSYPVLGVTVHGDSSFQGQGIIAEQLFFSQFPHFNNFGTVHLIVNNQIGYTIEGKVRDGEMIYTSNVMKSINSPIIHVNGSNPEEVIKAVRFALKYKETFNKDVLIDLICFRKHGHNELDDPTFTNNVLYKKIKTREHSIPIDYALNRVKMTKEEIKEIKSNYTNHLNEQLEQVNDYKMENSLLLGNWSCCKYPKKDQIEEWNTSINSQVLKYVGLLSMNIPPNFNLHKNLNRIFQNKIEKLKTGNKIDWALAETLAFGSLMYQGFNIRLSGQDVGRGTFSQRHQMIVDQDTDEPYIPLNALSLSTGDRNQEFIEKILSDNPNFELDLTNSKRNDEFGNLEIANSILSEEAVLAFEWGFSLESPKNLTIWEAQFGDFFNGSQIIFDTLITSGESKWGLQTGLIILLPHGMDGAGPEHSSGRLERFLQMSNSSQTHFDSDLVNLEIVFPTTPVQYFHLLRRQMLRSHRKPLIVFSPKLLLRHPECVSDLTEFEGQNRFKKIIVDQTKSKPAKKLIICTGKHYYTLKEHMKANKIEDVAIIRIEQLSPFPGVELKEALEKFSHLKDFVFSQEEHRNFGAYEFIDTRFRNLFGFKLRYVGRRESSVPAVGINQIHQKECSQIIEETFEMI